MSNLVKLLLGLATIGGTGVAINIFSNNNFTLNFNNPSFLSPTPSVSVTPKAKSVNYADCVKDSSTGEYFVAVKVGEISKRLIKIESGKRYWGDNYKKEDRCSMIAAQYNIAIDAGATGWSASMKNEFPIICAAKKDGCIIGSDKLPLQLLTFKKSVNPEYLATVLMNSTGYEGDNPDDERIIATAPTFNYHDFNIK